MLCFQGEFRHRHKDVRDDRAGAQVAGGRLDPGHQGGNSIEIFLARVLA